MKKLTVIALIGLLIVACRQKDPNENIGTLHAESEDFYRVVPKDALIENVGVLFEFTEGPAWHRDGYLIFSDIPANRIMGMMGRNFDVFREPSGNSNGLLVEKSGSVIACEHGSRSLTEYATDGTLTTLADNYKGARFNSPNDLCKSSSGVIYFTDPPWGLPDKNEDPAKEIPFNGVFMLKDGVVSLVDSTLSWPNGIALSPDEKYLYVANFENEKVDGKDNYEAFWVRYELNIEGEVVDRSIFFKAPDTTLPGGPDGMKVDARGNLFATGPGGILVISPDGSYLGRIELPIPPSNLAFGPKEHELYVTARSTIVKVTLK